MNCRLDHRRVVVEPCHRDMVVVLVPVLVVEEPCHWNPVVVLVLVLAAEEPCRRDQVVEMLDGDNKALGAQLVDPLAVEDSQGL